MGLFPLAIVTPLVFVCYGIIAIFGCLFIGLGAFVTGDTGTFGGLGM